MVNKESTLRANRGFPWLRIRDDLANVCLYMHLQFDPVTTTPAGAGDGSVQSAKKTTTVDDSALP